MFVIPTNPIISVIIDVIIKIIENDLLRYFLWKYSWPFAPIPDAIPTIAEIIAISCSCVPISFNKLVLYVLIKQNAPHIIPEYYLKLLSLRDLITNLNPSLSSFI